MSIKSERVSSEILKELGNIILTESTDKSFKNVSFTEAEVTNDLSNAKIYFVCLNEEEKEAIEKDLNEAQAFFKKFLSQKLDVRQIPDLKFIYDDTLQYAQNIEKIIEQINNK